MLLVASLGNGGQERHLLKNEIKIQCTDNDQPVSGKLELMMECVPGRKKCFNAKTVKLGTNLMIPKNSR